jgi:hypothetical protein
MRFICPDLNLNLNVNLNLNLNLNLKLKLKLNGETRLNRCTAKPNPSAF